MKKLGIYLGVTAILVGSAAQAKSKKDEAYAIYNQGFVAALNKNVPKEEIFQTLAKQKQFQNLQAAYASKANNMLLVSEGTGLCVISGASKMCWEPVIKGVKHGARFRAGEKSKDFFPTNSSDPEKTAAEFWEFATKAQREAGVWDLLMPSAFADDTPMVWENVKVKVKAKGIPEKEVGKVFPGLVAASLEGWRYLPADPTSYSVNRFAVNAKENLKDFTKNGKVSCNPVSLSVKRDDGYTADLITVKDNKFTMKVYDDKKKLKDTFELSYFTPQDTFAGSHQHCNPSLIPFMADTCHFLLPSQVVQVVRCPPGKQCTRIVMSVGDYTDEYKHERWRNVAAASGYSMKATEELIAADIKASKAHKEKNEAEIQKTHKEFKALYHKAIDGKYNKFNQLQHQMMRMTEVQKACDNGYIQRAVKDHSGVEFEGGAPISTDSAD